MGETERIRAQSSGWVHLEAPGQSGHVYVKAGDELSLTFDPDDKGDDP